MILNRTRIFEIVQKLDVAAAELDVDETMHLYAQYRLLASLH